METYVKQSKSSARTLSARAGHGQPDMATILQTYRNRTAQLAALRGDEEETLQGKFAIQFADPHPKEPQLWDEEERHEDTRKRKKTSGKGGHGRKLPLCLQNSEEGALYHELKMKGQLSSVFERAGLNSSKAPSAADENITGRDASKIFPVLRDILAQRDRRKEAKQPKGSRTEHPEEKGDPFDAFLELNNKDITKRHRRYMQNRYNEDPQGFIAKVKKKGHDFAEIVALFQIEIEEEEDISNLSIDSAKEDKEEKPLQGKFDVQSRMETLQRKFITSREEKEPLQQKTENRTGLPDRLKNGVESLSGYNLDAVKVHYNSPKPAQLQALAYTQGTDIHVGPGQEGYLGHEAWHVVQQMQGRVQPTTQLQGVAVNDNQGLEREADVMGEKAVAQLFSSNRIKKSFVNPPCGNLVQRLAENEGEGYISGIFPGKLFTGNQVFVSVAQVGSLFGHAEIIYEDEECRNNLHPQRACFGVMELTAGMSRSSARKGGSMSTGMGIMSSSSSTVSYSGGDASKSSHSSGSGSTSSNEIGAGRKFQFKDHFISPARNELHIVKNQTPFILSADEFKSMKNRFAAMNGAIDEYHYKLFSRGKDQSDLNCATFVMHLLGNDFYLKEDGNEMSREAVVTPYDVASKVIRRPVEVVDFGNLFD